MRDVLLLALAGLTAACGSASDDGDRPGYREIGSDAEPLRAAFDADRGKVRAILLVSPT